jgi:hypothetical protein
VATGQIVAIVIFIPMVTLHSLFTALNAGGGRYIVVGGLAVVLHGHPRVTGDVDLIIDLAAGDATKTLDALESAGFRPFAPVPTHDFADPAKRKQWAREKGMVVFSMRPSDGVPMVDLFIEHPIPFEALWQRSLVVTMRGIPVRIVSIDDLIQLKLISARPEDLTDIEALERIQQLRSTPDA